MLSANRFEMEQLESRLEQCNMRFTFYAYWARCTKRVGWFTIGYPCLHYRWGWVCS